MPDKRFQQAINALVRPRRRITLVAALPRGPVLGGQGYAGASIPETEQELLRVLAGNEIFEIDTTGAYTSYGAPIGSARGIAWTADYLYDRSGSSIQSDAGWTDNPATVDGVNGLSCNDTHACISGYNGSNVVAVAFYTHSASNPGVDFTRTCPELDWFGLGGEIVVAASSTHFVVQINEEVGLYTLAGGYITTKAAPNISYQTVVAIDADHFYFVQYNAGAPGYDVLKYDLTGSLISTSTMPLPGIPLIDLWAMEVTASGLWMVFANVNGAAANNHVKLFPVSGSGFGTTPTFDITLPSTAVNGDFWTCSKQRDL